MQCLGVLARVGRCGPSVLGSEARSSVLHRNLRRGAFGALWTPACQSNLALLVLGVVGRSLGWVAGGLAGSLGILWLAVHGWLLTEAVVRNYHQVFTRFDKPPECDNADLDQPKKLRIGPEHWTVIIQRGLIWISCNDERQRPRPFMKVWQVDLPTVVNMLAHLKVKISFIVAIKSPKQKLNVFCFRNYGFSQIQAFFFIHFGFALAFMSLKIVWHFMFSGMIRNLLPYNIKDR